MRRTPARLRTGFSSLLLLSVLLGTCAPFDSAPSQSVSTAVATAPSATRTYCSPQGTPLKLDLWQPVSSTPTPLVVHVHGGSWQRGNRHGGAFMDQLRPQLLARNLAVASIDYRLAPVSKWPAQIIDLKCALRFLRKQAEALNLDPLRFGAWGDSAGGQLVSVAALTGPEAGWDVGEHESYSSSLQSVANLYGPSQLTGSDWGDPQTITRVFGPYEQSSTHRILKAASPVTYVHAKAPPFLILHGDEDKVVTLNQSQLLTNALVQSGADATLVIVQGGAHGFTQKPTQPSYTQLVSLLADFFTRTLGAPSR